MNVLIINIETKKYVRFRTDNFSIFFGQEIYNKDEFNTHNALNGNYVYFPIKKYNEKISMKLASHKYFNILNILYENKKGEYNEHSGY